MNNITNENVIAVIDGETFETDIYPIGEPKKRIYLYGVSALKEGKNGHKESKEHLEKMISGKVVTIKELNEKSSNGKRVAEVYLGNVFINEVMRHWLKEKGYSNENK